MRLAFLLVLGGCGLQHLSSDVYAHQVAAANLAAIGDQDGAEKQLQQVAHDQIKLQRRASAVPPTPYP